MIKYLTASIEVDELINCLKKELKIKDFCQQLLEERIINKVSQARNLTVTETEIQTEADKQRCQMKLEKAADTLAWLEEQMITPENWEDGIRDRLLRAKLAESLFSQNVDKFFAQNKLNFDQVVLYQIIIPYEKLAWEIFYQIEEEEMSFYQAAHLYDIDEKRKLHCGYEGKLYRWEIHPNLAAAIFAAQPGEIISPIKIDKQYHILLVEKFISAELTPEIYQEILNKMFDEWLNSELNYLLHNSASQTANTNNKTT
ncbi:conserved hypothetical protein [Rippkaea orientalis PCC 8801]|uniref:peptidylprolyl isomerase n=1 Tax=Rippkaea orientalis (strain PCC 8801 / RF-1) TaxID=41431 RepID=B7JYE6_RIPO1|nr:peptidylprolyl isomerase [Rippkaea orientalis]ACK67248.1 conserved hypothetical protein [Rippkaea orientalis PCC 8801]